jgi:hypothetical protein
METRPGWRPTPARSPRVRTRHGPPSRRDAGRPACRPCVHCAVRCRRHCCGGQRGKRSAPDLLVRGSCRPEKESAAARVDSPGEQQQVPAAVECQIHRCPARAVQRVDVALRPALENPDSAVWLGTGRIDSPVRRGSHQRRASRRHRAQVGKSQILAVRRGAVYDPPHARKDLAAAHLGDGIDRAVGADVHWRAADEHG